MGKDIASQMSEQSANGFSVALLFCMDNLWNAYVCQDQLRKGAVQYFRLGGVRNSGGISKSKGFAGILNLLAHFIVCARSLLHFPRFVWAWPAKEIKSGKEINFVAVKR